MNKNEVLWDFHELLKSKGYQFDFLLKTDSGGYTHVTDRKGYVDLSSLTTLPENTTFSNSGSVDLRSLTTLPENTTFSNSGFVDLSSLTTLPENTTFSNNGSVDLRSLTTLPENTTFSNSGSVHLRSLTKMDAINCGSSNRNVKVIKQSGVLRIALGCFWATKAQAITAIKEKYKGDAATDYVNKITSAFALYE